MSELARDQLGGAERLTSGPAGRPFFGVAWQRRTEFDWFDAGSIALLCALTILVVATFRDYAITNDEWIQHRYGELIIQYYRSGFVDRSVFRLDNLYLYGGLFDVAAVLLTHVVALDPFALRHLMSALMGVAGLGSAIATARLIAGPRAGFLAGIALAVCGSWYGTMFHHTKDIPLSAAMAGALYFLIRAMRDCPKCRLRYVLGFGGLTGAALGIKVLALLLLCYVGIAILLNIPTALVRQPGEVIRFAVRSLLRFLPGLAVAYLIMIASWPWSALSPLNPVLGLVSFGEFHYGIRTVLDGEVYRMATVPRWYVPTYLVIKLPIPMLIGSSLALGFAAIPRLARTLTDRRRREIILVVVSALFPILCEVIVRGPAFSGLRHFLFVLPPLAILAGIGLSLMTSQLTKGSAAAGVFALMIFGAGFIWNAVTLYRLHPYEYLVYNAFVGGLPGATRRYATDYWFTMMPEAVDGLEAYLARTRSDGRDAGHVYTVAICGERASFLHKAPANLRWAQVWETADFFIAPTHMNWDQDSHGKVVFTVERLGVPIGFVKDQRSEESSGRASDAAASPDPYQRGR